MDRHDSCCKTHRICAKEPSCRAEPGGARYGNFPDYYSFNPAPERMRFLTNSIDHGAFTLLKDAASIRTLDIGCNTGELSALLLKWMQNTFPNSNVQLLGIDIDEDLINCARKHFSNNNMAFKCIDVMSEELQTYEKFDVLFCFAVTMWLHINNGDDGLTRFLLNISRMCTYLIVEAQPWKCYKTAVRRTQRAGLKPFPFFSSLKIRENITEFIDKFLLENCGFIKLQVLGTTKWNREIIFYKRES